MPEHPKSRALAGLRIALALLLVPLLNSTANADERAVLIPILEMLMQQSSAGSGPGPGDPGAPCARSVSDDVVVDTVWRNTAAYCDVLVVPRNASNVNSGRAPVAIENATLTIEPGTRVRFAFRGSIAVQDGGSLQAVGTPQQRIAFESEVPQRGYARGLYFPNGRVSRLEYVDLIHLGREEALSPHDAAIVGLRTSAGLVMRHSTVVGSATHGAEFDRLNIVAFENNVFADNAQFGLIINARQAHKLDAESDYSGASLGSPNARPYVRVDGVGSFDTVEQDATWKALGTPWFVDIAVNVDRGHLAIEPGAQFVMDQGARFDIDGPGTFAAVGTPARPIVFRGEQAVAGHWDNINFYQTDSIRNRLEHVVVQHAGRGSADGAIELPLRASAYVGNATITDSASDGICVGFESRIQLGTGNRFERIAGQDVRFDC